MERLRGNGLEIGAMHNPTPLPSGGLVEYSSPDFSQLIPISGIAKILVPAEQRFNARLLSRRTDPKLATKSATAIPVTRISWILVIIIEGSKRANPVASCPPKVSAEMGDRRTMPPVHPHQIEFVQVLQILAPIANYVVVH